ncbi:hypothetical protein PENTCL1PPCAC_12816, partial [Pristionchus entomophagus]
NVVNVKISILIISFPNSLHPSIFSAMPAYKLYYFDIRGRGEVVRQVLALAGVEFEDIRLPRPSDGPQWAEFKSKTSFGQMPVLEIDGKQIPQAFAIVRFIASQHGLAGATPFEAAWVDAIADQWKDFHTEFSKYLFVKLGFREGNEDLLKAEHGFPSRDNFFPLIEQQLQETGSGFLVGDSVTWVDLLIAEAVQVIASAEPGFLDAFPEVLKHEQKIHSISRIKKWIESRPDQKR